MSSTDTSALQPCRYCGAYHTSVCPRVEAVEYYSNGSVKKVTLRPVVPTPPARRQY